MRSRIVGEVNIVGDKSISHRAIILSSLASGKSILSNVLISGDTKATINIFKNLGVEINEISNNQWAIRADLRSIEPLGGKPNPVYKNPSTIRLFVITTCLQQN